MIHAGWLLIALLSASPEVDPVELLGPLRLEGTGPRVGDWITYRAETDSGLVVFLRFAVVGEGEGGLWLELESGLAPGMESPLLRLTLLCERLQGRLTGHILRAFAAAAHEAAQEVNPALLETRHEPGSGTATESRVGALPGGFVFHRGRRQIVMTRSGTFTAWPWELRYDGKVVKRLWMSEQAPVLRLVKIELPALGQEIDLYASGIGAVPGTSLPPEAGTSFEPARLPTSAESARPRPGPL